MRASEPDERGGADERRYRRVGAAGEGRGEVRGSRVVRRDAAPHSQSHQPIARRVAPSTAPRRPDRPRRARRHRDRRSGGPAARSGRVALERGGTTKTRTSALQGRPRRCATKRVEAQRSPSTTARCTRRCTSPAAMATVVRVGLNPNRPPLGRRGGAGRTSTGELEHEEEAPSIEMQRRTPRPSTVLGGEQADGSAARMQSKATMRSRPTVSTPDPLAAATGAHRIARAAHTHR